MFSWLTSDRFASQTRFSRFVIYFVGQQNWTLVDSQVTYFKNHLSSIWSDRKTSKLNIQQFWCVVICNYLTGWSNLLLCLSWIISIHLIHTDGRRGSWHKTENWNDPSHIGQQPLIWVRSFLQNSFGPQLKLSNLLRTKNSPSFEFSASFLALWVIHIFLIIFIITTTIIMINITIIVTGGNPMYLLGTGGAEDAAVYCIKLWKHIVTVDSFSSHPDKDYGEEGEQKFDPKMGNLQWAMGNGIPWHPNGCNPLPPYEADQS